jgi:DUF4097 and DUF4098 domain-containing protein YvlB
MANGHGRPRSIAGPTIVITLGIVLLLANMHLLAWEALWMWFGKLWPVLIIVWGVIRLIEHQRARGTGQPGPRFGGGAVVLLIILISMGMSATLTHRINLGPLFPGDWGGDDLGVWGDTFSYDDQMVQDFPAGGSLRIQNERGEVNVNVEDTDKIRVLVRKRVGASSQSEADRYHGQTKPTITVSDKSVIVNANNQGSSRRVETDLDIFVPRNAVVTISSVRGDVAVLTRAADVEISSGRGTVSLEDITGNAKLNLELSGVRVTRVSGNVTVDGRANEVSVADVKGSLRLTGDFLEDVRLAGIGKSVSFRSSRTDLEFGPLQGSLELDGSDLRGISMTGPVRLLTKSKDIRLDGVSGDVRISNSNGAVEVHINRVPVGNVDIVNRDADVQVYVPDQAGFRVDAMTDNGEVATDFDALKTKNEDDRGTLSGSVGNGAGLLKISNQHGGIEVRKGSMLAAEVPSPPRTPTPPALPKKPGSSGKPEIKEF